MKRNMDVEWGYEGKTGPEHWHELCDWYADGAKFPLQSPIALVKDETVSDPSYTPVKFHYQAEDFTEKEFKNTIHFVPFDTVSYVEFEGDKYYLTDIHFHRPSEHFLTGKQFPLECHLVHMNAQHKNLVCGTFMEISETGILEPLGKALDYAQHFHHFDPSVFLPQEHTHYHYIGSLTTPPTSGPINWFLYEKPLVMGQSFLERFKEEIAQNNFRPLQERKGRKIDYYHE